MEGLEESTLRLNSTPDADECWALLERLAASAQLKRSARMQELLFYIGKRFLKDGCECVHEQEIGSQVFKRPDSYDTNFDNIVRTNVSDLRKRIETYFQLEGAHEPLTVEIPRGGYTPVFRYRSGGPEILVEHPVEVQASNLKSPAAIARGFYHRGWLIAGLVMLLIATGCALFFWGKYRALNRSLHPWQYQPSVAELWSEILNANSDTDIVVSDSSISLVQALSHRTFSLSDYLSRNYIAQLQTEDLSPDTRADVNLIMGRNLGTPDEFSLARRFLDLDPLGRKIHLYSARYYVPDLIKRDNVILIGAKRSNPWQELFEGRLNFVENHDVNGVIINHTPAAREQQTYTATNSVDYCVVAYMPNLDHSGVVLLIEGTGPEATEGGGDFLLSENQLANFKRMLHVSKFPYFEVLLKVTSVKGTPLTTTVEAYRSHPNLH
jgi:hypothetical protein